MSSCAEGGTIQWMSPELLDPRRFGFKKSHPTKESDYYALGMVIYEVLSGHAPFARTKPPVVILKVMEGERPEKPQGEEGRLFTEDIWSVLERCWRPEPSDRPSAKAVLQCLEGSPPLSRSPSSEGGAVETDTDDESDTSADDSGMSPPPVRSPRLPGLPVLSPKGSLWDGRVGKLAYVWTAVGVMYRQEVPWILPGAALDRVGPAGIEGI